MLNFDLAKGEFKTLKSWLAGNVLAQDPGQDSLKYYQKSLSVAVYRRASTALIWSAGRPISFIRRSSMPDMACRNFCRLRTRRHALRSLRSCSRPYNRAILAPVPPCSCSAGSPSGCAIRLDALARYRSPSMALA